MAKFSVILPVRNGGEYIKACIESLLSQTFTDFNILVLENCSTDGTREWLERLEQPKIILLPSDKPLSIEQNWARITTISKNEFITITGHDDIFAPNYLETMAQLIEQYPDAALYQAHFNFIDENGELIRPCKPIKHTLNPVEYFEGVLSNSLEVTGTGFIFRSSAYDANGGIPDYPNLLYADIEIWMKLIRNSYMVVSAVNCFSFRFHLRNTSKSSGPFRLRAFERMVDFFLVFTRQNPELAPPLAKLSPAFMTNYVVGACHKLIYIPKSSRNGLHMNHIIDSAVACAGKLMPGAAFNPRRMSAVKLAWFIDGNGVLRKCFLMYKSLSKRTF